MLRGSKPWNFGVHLSLVLVSYFIVLVLRTLHSIGRLPADPGYGYILGGATNGISALTVGDPYFHVGARLLALLTSIFPLESQAIALALLVHVVWATCGAIVAFVVRMQYESDWFGYLAGLLLILSPHASESSIGNVGNVKWPLLTALTLIACSSKSSDRFRVSTLIFTMVVGLTQPLTIMCGLPIVMAIYRRRYISRQQLVFLGTISGTLLIQVAKVGLGTAFTGQASKVTMPWDGMGAFWWSGLLGPAIISLFCIGALLIFRTRHGQNWHFNLSLSVQALLLSVVSYRMGGIGDRYFVAPMALSLIAMFGTVIQITRQNLRFRYAGGALLILLVLIPTAKWFSASWYLTSGPTWSEEVSRARVQCRELGYTQVELAVSPSGTEQLHCDFVLDE